MGRKCRYDGQDRELSNLDEYKNSYDLLPVCPEVDGGLGIPRPKAWIENGSGDDVWRGRSRVINEQGANVTAQFKAGAEHALEIAIANKIRKAILKAKSPSCGAGLVYNDGRGKLVEGNGVTAELLMQSGFEIEVV